MPKYSFYPFLRREVLKDPPFLIAGCTAIIVMFDANTMDAIFQLDLTGQFHLDQEHTKNKQQLAFWKIYLCLQNESEKVLILRLVQKKHGATCFATDFFTEIRDGTLILGKMVDKQRGVSPSC